MDQILIKPFPLTKNDVDIGVVVAGFGFLVAKEVFNPLSHCTKSAAELTGGAITGVDELPRLLVCPREEAPGFFNDAQLWGRARASQVHLLVNRNHQRKNHGSEHSRRKPIQLQRGDFHTGVEHGGLVEHIFVHAVGAELFQLHRNVFDASVAFFSSNLNQGVSDIIHQGLITFTLPCRHYRIA